MTAKLSIVIPAYQEEHRLPGTLRAISAYCDKTPQAVMEVVIVDDGSSDRTSDVCAQWRTDGTQLEVLRHHRNLGKGAAIRTGVKHARGDLILIMDADGAVPLEEEAKLRSEIVAGADIACGSRLLPGSESSRTVLRKTMGNGFAWLMRLAFGLPIRDTQCGFKMFSARAARVLFPSASERGYLADVEILLRARHKAMVMREVPVRYRDVPGSRLYLWRDSWKMVLGLWRLKLARISSLAGQPENSSPTIGEDLD